jgi:ABC-type multidrug transport system ATPase subunit
VLSHDLHLYSDLTARENLVFFGRLYGVGDAETQAERALQQARLDDRGADLVSGFSRGMRQRLALERALLHAPRLLLLDEPFTGLDDASTVVLIERLRELRLAGCITLLATHDHDVAEAVLDRAVILQDGRLVSSEQDVRGLRKRYQERLQAARAAS